LREEDFMNQLIKSRKALATVVTTLIILVVAVLLAGVVVFYAINVTSTRVQEESLQIQRQHIWHNGQGFAEGAFLISNTGGRDIVMDKISVRGQECAWSTVYFSRMATVESGDLTYVTPNVGDTLTGLSVTIDATTYDFTPATGALILQSGHSMLVYITNPDSVAVNDVGVTIGITIFTANAQYYKECNVEATLVP
jgi:hypothetical protein